jgi:hypothetical protein
MNLFRRIGLAFHAVIFRHKIRHYKNSQGARLSQCYTCNRWPPEGWEEV